MVEFKFGKDRTHWNEHPTGVSYDKEANARLRALVSLIDNVCTLNHWASPVMTCYWRPDDLDSYHSIFQAVDIRTHNQPDLFKVYMGVIGSILKQINPQNQIYTHKELWGTPNEHLHVAIKKGNPIEINKAKNQIV